MIVEVFDMMTSRIYNNKIPSSVSYPYILPRLRAALLKQSRGKTRENNTYSKSEICDSDVPYVSGHNPLLCSYATAR